MTEASEVPAHPQLSEGKAKPTAEGRLGPTNLFDPSMFQKEEAPAMSGALTDRGFHQRETGMDQGTTPEVNIIGLLGKKKKPLPNLLGS